VEATTTIGGCHKVGGSIAEVYGPTGVQVIAAGRELIEARLEFERAMAALLPKPPESDRIVIRALAARIDAAWTRLSLAVAADGVA
jgi:hypothetical protein